MVGSSVPDDSRATSSGDGGPSRTPPTAASSQLAPAPAHAHSTGTRGRLRADFRLRSQGKSSAPASLMPLWASASSGHSNKELTMVTASAILGTGAPPRYACLSEADLFNTTPLAPRGRLGGITDSVPFISILQ